MTTESGRGHPTESRSLPILRRVPQPYRIESDVVQLSNVLP